MAKSKRGKAKTKSNSIKNTKSNNDNSQTKYFFSILLIALVVYSIYHLIMIDFVEGLQILSAIIVALIIYKVSEIIIKKLRK